MTDAIAEAAAALLVPADETGTPIEGEALDNTAPEVLEGGEAAEVVDEAKTPEDELIDELAAEDDTPEEDAPPPPHSWKAEDAEVWNGMNEAQREVVGRREKERDAYVTELGRKTAGEQRQLEQQASQAVAQQAENHANELYAYMQLTAPGVPDERLLYTQNPDDRLVFQRQEAAYRSGLAQQHELQQRIAGYQQHAAEVRRQSDEADLTAQAQFLQAELPQFFDPDEGPKLRQTLESIGSELGYPSELMAQADASDIMALKKAAEWRDDALKYRKIISKRMETVRGAKNLPRMSRPNAGQGPGAARIATEEQRDAAISQFQRDRSGEAALALLAGPRK